MKNRLLPIPTPDHTTPPQTIPHSHTLQQSQNQPSNNNTQLTTASTTSTLLKKQKLLKTFLKIIYFIMIIMVLFYAIILCVFNYMDYYQDQQIQYDNLLLENNSVMKFMYCSSSIHSILDDGIIIILQTVVLMVMTVVVWGWILCFHTWVDYLNKNVESQNPLISQYGILIKGKLDFYKRDQKEVKQFMENFCDVTIKEKIKQLKSYKHQISQSERKQLISLIHISNNNNLIQKIIFFSSYCQNFMKQNRKMPSRYILILFTYKYVPSIILSYWKNEQDLRKSIRSDVQKIISTPNPNQIMWQKLHNQHQLIHRIHSYIIFFILTQLLYISLITFFTFFIISPQTISSHTIITEHKQLFIFLTATIYSLFIILQQIILKSIITKITYLKSDLNLIKFKIDRNKIFFWVSLINVVYLPILIFLICGGVLQSDGGFYTILIQRDIQLMAVFSSYAAFKCFILPIAMIIINLTCKQTCVQNKNIVFQYQKPHIFDQLSQQITLFCIISFYSILITPLLTIAYLIGALIKLYNLLSIGHSNILSDDFSIKTFWQFLQIQLNKMKTFIIIKCFFIANSILVYLSIKNLKNDVYLIILNICFYVLYVIIDVLIIKYGFFWDKENRNRQLYKVIRKMRVFYAKINVEDDNDKRNKNNKNNKYKQVLQDGKSQMNNIINNNQANKKQLVQKYIKQLKNRGSSDFSNSNYEDSQFLQIQQVQRRCYKKQRFQLTYQQIMQRRQPNLSANTNPTINCNIFLHSIGEKNQVIQQLNTMSRSLQATLKQKLFQKPPDPLILLTKTQPQQQQQDPEYEQKVFMPQSKQKFKVPPLLNLQKIIKERQINQKDKNNNNLKLPIKQHKQKNIQNNKIVDSDISFSLVLNEKNQKRKEQIKEEKKKEEKKKGENKKITPKRQKVKFVTLFDSQDDNLKQVVRKKIKSSIQKIQY